MLQSRLVRLVCVFMHSLIRNKVVKTRELQYTVEVFSLEFSKIKEAAALFRLIKDENGSS